jgi:hypothetical protein
MNSEKNVDPVKGNITKREIYWLIFFTFILPVFFGLINYKDIETFLAITCGFGFMGLVVGTLFILFIRLFKDGLKQKKGTTNVGDEWIQSADGDSPKLLENTSKSAEDAKTQVCPQKRNDQPDRSSGQKPPPVRLISVGQRQKMKNTDKEDYKVCFSGATISKREAIKAEVVLLFGLVGMVTV